MVKYLQMDGVDDYILTPNITKTIIEMDIYLDSFDNTSVVQFILNNSAYGAVYNGTYKSGIGDYFGGIYVNNQGIINSNSIPSRQRILLKLTKDVPYTSISNIFSDSKGSRTAKGKIYNIKFYNGTTLVAHYDMSTGTVLDQSGNGNHATLTGGTWLDDGTGGSEPVGEDGSISISTKQTIYADEQLSQNTKQFIYSDDSIYNATNQAIFADENSPYPTSQIVYFDDSVSSDTKQIIYEDNLINFATAQEIYNDGQIGSINYPLLLQLYSDEIYTLNSNQYLYEEGISQLGLSQQLFENNQMQNSTKQIIYSDSISQYSTNQSVYSDDNYNLSTKQSIYANNSINYDTLQRIYEQSTLNLQTTQSIYQLDTVDYLTLQTLFVDGLVNFDTVQQFLDDYVEYRQVLKYIMQINQSMNADLRINGKQVFDLTTASQVNKYDLNVSDQIKKYDLNI